jgi:mRNA-degrading endonuclease YafQ of YafQ-DinJ toxin-antitoxin module
VKVEFKKSFAKDLKKKSKDRTLLAKVEEIIGQVDEAEGIHQIPNLKKL